MGYSIGSATSGALDGFPLKVLGAGPYESTVIASISNLRGRTIVLGHEFVVHLQRLSPPGSHTPSNRTDTTEDLG